MSESSTAAATPAAGAASYDAIIVGGGHNGLVAAAYLGRAGMRVAVLERRHLVGGAAVTEELWPGFKVSTASYVVSLMSPRIVSELALERYGYHVYQLDPAYFAPFPDGRGFLLWDDPARAAEAIGAISPADGRGYLAYSRALSELADMIRPLLYRVPPEAGGGAPGDAREVAGLGRYAFGARRDIGRLTDLMTMSAYDFLSQYFVDESIMGAMCAGSVIGAWGGPMSPGSAYVLLHHRMGETDGVTGAWGFVRGGMGALSEAIASSARAAGAEIHTNAEVTSIDVAGGRTTGVTLADGTVLHSEVVLSGAHPHTTFLSLVGRANLPSEFATEIERYRTRGSSAKVNMAISELPDLIAMPGKEPGPQHPEIMISPSINYVERAWDDAKYGRPSEHPLCDCVIPTTKDPTLAPQGAHIMTVFVQYAPSQLAEGTWDDHRETLGDRVVDTITEYAPNFKASVIHREVLSPADLESRFGLVGGNIFQGEISLDQLFSFRPAPRAASYKTPVHGLYLCGSGAHPGGGVMGIPALNATKVVLRDLKRRRRRETLAGLGRRARS
ncbi:MAG: NAD(P)/FAD-dependent oxidoreductase [Actinobacteria bacterium]|nr:NAD(P)/FAD-dependent oxidoreductase [Actinomycetota bacterium]